MLLFMNLVPIKHILRIVEEEFLNEVIQCLWINYTFLEYILLVLLVKRPFTNNKS